jgi:exodeoxyribonuclease VII small subunit
MKKAERAEAKAGETQAQTAPLSFEAAQARLETIVSQLEGGDLPLEQSLALFEEGVGLARRAQEQLDRAERRIEELLGVDPSGKPITRELGG